MTPLDAFQLIHSNLSREGPGSDASTRALLAVAQPFLPPAPQVLDLGCGPGAQTASLCRALPGARIVAIDLHEPYLAQVRALNLPNVRAFRLDFRQIGALPPDNDLLWCEGAAYFLGFREALRLWRPLVRVGGIVGVTEVVWLETPPEEIQKWWAQAYPAMTTVTGCERRAQEAGYRVLGQHILPRTDWTDEYYRPLLQRAEALAAQDPLNVSLRRAVQATRQEADMHSRFGDTYSYVGLVLQKTDAPDPA